MSGRHTLCLVSASECGGGGSSRLFRSGPSQPAAGAVFPHFLEQDHARRPGQQEEPHFQRNRSGAEQFVAERRVVDQQDERHLECHAPQDQAVAGNAGSADRAQRAAAQEYIDDLQQDDRRQAGGGRLPVQEIVGGQIKTISSATLCTST